MLRNAVTYICTLMILVAFDFAFLWLVAAPMFRTYLGDVLLPSFRPAPAILFYLLFTAGILFFVTPSVRDSWAAGAGAGVMFGLVAYGTYELTNYATLRPWTLNLVLTDMVWGCILTALAGTLGVAVADWLLRLLGHAQ